MARAGLLHVTVIAATLLRDTGGSDSEPVDTYASVGCGNQNFTTNSVKNHRAKPSWNESHTFKFEEKNELESQHILIEIFAEKPKLDELLGLAKIPLQKVLNVGDEISTHSLNRPDEEYIGHEQYSGHVKVALRWDSAQASAPAYPQTYTPAARYNPNVSTSRIPTTSRETNRSNEQLQTSKSGGHELLHRHQEDNCETGQDRRVHHRSSSYPSRSYSFGSSAPTPSQSPWTKTPIVDDISTPRQHPSNLHPPGGHPSEATAPRHSSFEARSNASRHEHGRGPSPHVPYAGPHVPYVPHEGNKVRSKTSGQGHAHTKAVESDVANPDPKLQDDIAKLKLSKSKQAEMAKLAELSRLTESAKIQATGFAKAGQHQSPWSAQSIVQPHQQSQASSKLRNKDRAPRQQPNQIPSKQMNDAPLRVQDQTKHHQDLRRPKKDDFQPQQRLNDGSQRFELPSKQLTVVPTMLDIVQAQPQKAQRDEKHGQVLITSQRPADVFYGKAIQKAEKPEKKKGSPFRRTLKILRKTSKIFGI